MLVRIGAADLIGAGLSCVLAGLFIGMAFDDVGSRDSPLLSLVGVAASLLTAVFLVRDAQKVSPPAP
jgi:hypothetical protein